jgi:ketosteroid isomerase-like protein
VTASANLDLVRSIISAHERGDYSSAKWADPEIEFVIADGPSPGRWAGLAGMAEGLRDWLSAWEGFRSEASDYRQIDDGRVLVLARFHGHGKTGGLDVAEMGTKAASLYHVRGGAVTRLVLYWDRERAFADLGLAPEGDAPPPLK